MDFYGGHAKTFHSFINLAFIFRLYLAGTKIEIGYPKVTRQMFYCISAKINANCISVSVCATWFKVP